MDKIAYDTAEGVLGGEAFVEEKVSGWSNAICEKIVAQLTQTERSYKYMANVLIMQRNGAGLQTCTSCLWDTVTDFISHTVWPKEKQSKDLQVKNQMHCLITVYIISII